MIKPRPAAVSVLCANGETVSFDPAVLHAEILQSFIRSGTSETYLAEDIALAVEYSLVAGKHQREIFTVSEINTAVIAILEKVGFAAAATCFRDRHNPVRMSMSAHRQSIAAIIERHLTGGDEFADELAAKVTAAVNTIGVAEARPALYLELARYYLKNGSSGIAIPQLHGNAKSAVTISADELCAVAGIDIAPLFAADIISVAPVSAIFKTLRVKLHLCAFAAQAELTAPITEMMIQPMLYRLGDELEKFLCAAQKLYAARTGDDQALTAYIGVPDLADFARDWLNWSWPQAEKSCCELLAPLTAEFSLR